MKRKLTIFAATLILIFALCSCDDLSDVGTSNTDTAKDTDVFDPISNDDTSSDTAETEIISDTMIETDTESSEETTSPAETETVIPEFTNPLTGLASETDLSSKRPAAIMINNVKQANPQQGIGEADIIYECLAEGGITRLLMFKMEYETLGTVGSIRSSRHYYIDFAQDFDAIYIHAGGSPMAYEALKTRDIDNLDGVASNPADMFFRDQWRKKNMGYAHSLMTTGDGIAAAVKRKKYRTEISEDFVNPFTFIDFGETVVPDGGDATHVMLRYHKNQEVDLVYDNESGKYLRYQFGGKPHIDEITGEQLSFDNIIIVLTDLWAIKGDEDGRLEVVTVGDGNGYYITNGKYVPIKWSKADGDAQISYTLTDGSPLIINRGKTFVSVFDKDYKYVIDNSSFETEGN